MSTPTNTLAPEAIHPDAELIAACAEFRALQAPLVTLYEQTDHDGTVGNLVSRRAAAVLGRMSRLKATTAEGVLARMQAYIAFAPDYFIDFPPENEGWDGPQLQAMFRDAAAMDPTLCRLVEAAKQR